MRTDEFNQMLEIAKEDLKTKLESLDENQYMGKIEILTSKVKSPITVGYFARNERGILQYNSKMHMAEKGIMSFYNDDYNGCKVTSYFPVSCVYRLNTYIYLPYGYRKEQDEI